MMYSKSPALGRQVWKAYDMEQHRYCAVKIHEVKKDYTEEQKDSYVRHAVRESPRCIVLNFSVSITFIKRHSLSSF